jgi:hypothetical protein
VPRPSSPLGAKASTRCPSLELAHAQPQAHILAGYRPPGYSSPVSGLPPSGLLEPSAPRGGPQAARGTAGQPASSHAYRRLPRAKHGVFAPPGRRAPASLHTHAQARCHRPHTSGRRASRLLHGHDSLHDVIRTVDRRTAHTATKAVMRAPPHLEIPGSDHVVSSVPPEWWAWADLNGRPHAYQACALTS